MMTGDSSSNDGSDTDDFGSNPMNESAASRMSIGSDIRDAPPTGIFNDKLSEKVLINSFIKQFILSNQK